jgi:hypothetical protein
MRRRHGNPAHPLGKRCELREHAPDHDEGSRADVGVRDALLLREVGDRLVHIHERQRAVPVEIALCDLNHATVALPSPPEESVEDGWPAVDLGDVRGDLASSIQMGCEASVSSRHVAKLCAVRPKRQNHFRPIGPTVPVLPRPSDVLLDDQLMPRVDRDLHVVIDPGLGMAGHRPATSRASAVATRRRRLKRQAARRACRPARATSPPGRQGAPRARTAGRRR